MTTDPTPRPRAIASGTSILCGLTPRRVVRWFVFAIALLTVLSVAEQYVIHILGRADLEEYLIAVDLDAEGNIPTWYQSFTLLAASLLLAVVAAHTRARGGRYPGHWQVLSVILGILSMDELAQIHEHLGRLHEAWQTHGIFYFAWVIPGAIAALVSLGLFARFLWHLPAPIRTRFVLAGVIYFSGALGVEALGGWRAETMGMNNMTHSLIATGEEDLEMIGVATLIVALLRHMAVERMSLLISSADRAALPSDAESAERAAA